LAFPPQAVCIPGGVAVRSFLPRNAGDPPPQGRAAQDEAEFRHVEFRCSGKKFLRQEWVSCTSGVQSSGVDPKLAYMCLQNVVRRMAAPGMRKTLDLWADNIGKNVSHHSGWLATCLKLHVIEKVADNARGSGVLVLGKDQGRYKLLVYNDKLFGDAFKRNEQQGSILQNMPTSKWTSEWMAAIMSARTDADNRKFAWKSLEYLWPWMLRSHMIAQTRTRGIHAMSIGRLFRCSELEDMAPDQRKHIDKLRDDITSAIALFKLLGYDGPPELHVLLHFSGEGL
jgi:hypothetical protein